MRGGQRATSRWVPGARGLGAPERPREEATRSPAPLGAARGPCRPERSVRPRPRAGTRSATAAETRAAAAEPGGRRECGTGARAEAARHGAGAAAAGGLRGALASRRTLRAPAPASASRAHRGHGQGAAQGGPGAAAAAGERALRGLRRPGLLREQWIRAKYERQEFIYPEKQEPYSAGYREGFLWKRGRDNGQFLSRKFVLTEREGALKYFNRNDAKEPKAVMKIEHLNATFQPAKIGHPHGLQVTYLKDNSTRNIFIYHEDGKEIVDWFNALRAARFHYLQVAFPGASDADLVPKLSRNYLKEGYMEKTGPKQTEGFRKRWFTMDDRRLMYFKDPLDAFARGEVFIGSKESGYTVLHGFPPSTQGHHWPHGITIVTPDRKFLFACETESDQREWVAAFQKAVDRPMLPQEYAVEAHFKHKP
uniref:ArfGAP with dual PH domains 1 n=1 Tax=Macaca fascicularis TaxID=9541 RepID=A0A7N9CZP6_MACFA